MITEVFLLFRYFSFKRKDQALPFFFRWYVVFCLVSTRLLTIVFLVKRNKEAIQNMRLKTFANGSITWYGVTPQVYWFNKTDYKGNMLLGRLPLGRKWNFTAGSSHTLVNWVTLIRVGFEKVVITVNVDSLEHATGHWASVFTCSSSYWTTISQNVTYISKLVTKGLF